MAAVCRGTGFLDLGNPVLEGSVVPQQGPGAPGQSLWCGSGEKSPEAEETLQIVHIRKFLCITRVVKVSM